MTDTNHDLEVWKARSITLRRLVKRKTDECLAHAGLLGVAKEDCLLWQNVAKLLLNDTGATVYWCPGCLRVQLATSAKTVDGDSVLAKLCPDCLARSDNPW